MAGQQVGRGLLRRPSCQKAAGMHRRPSGFYASLKRYLSILLLGFFCSVLSSFGRVGSGFGRSGSGASGGVRGGSSSVGGGRGSIVTAVIGAVAGGLLGSATEEGLTRTQGVEITVREDDGSMRAYVQAVQENEIFRIGDRVRIMTVDGTSRVTR